MPITAKSFPCKKHPPKTCSYETCKKYSPYVEYLRHFDTCEERDTPR